MASGARDSFLLREHVAFGRSHRRSRESSETARCRAHQGRVASLEDVLLQGASAERFRALLVGLFAGAGVLLAVVGIYAMTAASVTARTWDASLRVALGAHPWRIAGTVIRDAGIQVMVGVVLGLVAFWSLGRLISGLLFQTSAMDSVVLLASVGGLTLLALSAAVLQARRLAAVSPALVLRGSEKPGLSASF